MPLEIVFGPEAERDLDGIDDHLAAYSSTAAERLTEEIEARCARIAEFPQAGRARPEIGVEVRSFAVSGKATVLYQYNALTLTVLRVYLAGRDFGCASDEDDNL